MGQILNRFKYKRECYKCRLIDIELTDSFEEDTMTHIPIIELIKTRNMRKEYIYHKIKNRMMNINKIYSDEINNR